MGSLESTSNVHFHSILVAKANHSGQCWEDRLWPFSRGTIKSMKNMYEHCRVHNLDIWCNTGPWNPRTKHFLQYYLNRKGVFWILHKIVWIRKNNTVVASSKMILWTLGQISKTVQTWDRTAWVISEGHHRANAQLIVVINSHDLQLNSLADCETRFITYQFPLYTHPSFYTSVAPLWSFIHKIENKLLVKPISTTFHKCD